MKYVGRHHLRTILFFASLACMGLSCPATAGAATASWRFEPSSFDFGVRLPDEGPTIAKAFELQNTGEVPLTPAFVSVTNQSGSGFELAGNSCTKSLAPGTGCQIEVTFDPSSGGRKEATLAVESTSGVAAATSQLLGSGGEPVVVIEPAAITFDTITIPTAAVAGTSERTVRVTNAGSVDLTIDSLTFEEIVPSSSRFNFGMPGGPIGPGLCMGATIPPGSSCGLNLSFIPKSPGTYRAEIGLVDNAPGSPQVISLFGTAVGEIPGTPMLPPPPPEASLPKLTRKPPSRTRSRTATFEFSANSSPNGFVCRHRKHGRFLPCTSPVHLRGLKPGLHLFAVRGIGIYGTPGPISSYHWRIVR